MKGVPPPTTKKLRDSQLFSNPNGLPNYKLLKEHFKREGKLTENQVLRILSLATAIFLEEPNMLNVPAPVTVCGDIHGQYYDLLKLFEVCGDPDETSFLFLGDYVDRGSYSLECLLLLYSMKINHPTTFFMMRGNHETKQMTTHFTFQSECILKYSEKVYESSLYSFTTLPITAIMNNQFFCVHGGISKHLRSLDDINNIDRFVVDFPSSGLYCDLMWADPAENYDTDESRELYKPNYERGCSFMFTFKAVCKFLQQNNLLCVIRAHQAQDSGYRMYKKTQQQFPSVITLFSAPNYCGTYGNKAAVLKYESMVMNIRQFSNQPEPYHLPNFLDVFTWSIPFVAERTADILLSLLNVCTEEELGEETPLAKHIANMSLGDSNRNNNSNDDDTDMNDIPSAVKEPRTLEQNAIRNKILAIGRVSRMFNMLRQEAEKKDNVI
ncbi:unnamed protein product [Ambrosiozyma monospora]|uniref:Unnamed protein product n=1 Tax=Ambrosiozyma monospora TaxID=43982 RepID=A0ACB5TVZ8_AMBMO|nr:unnamed protein product [Ambrosiozyma monospora]